MRSGRARAAVASAALVLAGLAGCTLFVDSLVQEPVASCEGHPDGTPCRSAEICVAGQCTFSACGDGYVDGARGETCDDQNLVAGDGCEPGRCRYSCANDDHCEDADPCTENAGCDLVAHVCHPAIPTSGAACVRPDTSAGTCRMGICAPPGCGDGELDAGEDCDDDTAGCAPDCQYACEDERPCTTDDVCEHPLVCDPGTHTCEDGEPLACEDDDDCTAESCVPLTGCESTIIDADGDGYSPGTCADGSAATGGDCDDQLENRHPGAPEMLNGLDDDCDAEIDEDPGLTCLLDSDGDGYGDPEVSMFATVCPDGWVPVRVRDDCNDDNASVHPGITAPSATPFCYAGTVSGSAAEGYTCAGGGGVAPSWDFDCDGEEEPAVASAVVCQNAAVCGAVGWASVVPGCGALGTLRSCVQNCTLLLLCTCNTNDVPGVAQGCR